MIINGDKAIAAAFVKARAEIGATVAKDTKGNYGKYASLAALTEATTAALAKYNLAIVQEAELSDSGVTVETWLIHDSGATIQFTPLTMPLTDRKPQAVGSAITYARRYQLGAVCGIAPDDDDGEAAQGNRPPMQQRPQAPRPQALNPNAASKMLHVPPQPIEVNMDEVEELNPNPEPARTVLDAAMLKRLNVTGRELYGEEWDTYRPQLCEWASKGAVKSSKELTQNEAERAIAAMQRKLEAKRQPEPIAA